MLHIFNLVSNMTCFQITYRLLCNLNIRQICILPSFIYLIFFYNRIEGEKVAKRESRKIQKTAKMKGNICPREKSEQSVVCIVCTLLAFTHNMCKQKTSNIFQAPLKIRFISDILQLSAAINKSNSKNFKQVSEQPLLSNGL